MSERDLVNAGAESVESLARFHELSVQRYSDDPEDSGLAACHSMSAAMLRALCAERDRLRAAIQAHRDCLWGTGRVGRVDDVALYGALRCEGADNG